MLVAGSMAATPAQAAPCMTVFADDFESGGTSGWDAPYGGWPAVASAGAIAGRYSLSSSLRVQNALRKDLPAAGSVHLTMTFDLRGATFRASPVVVTLSSKASGADLVWLYFSVPIFGSTYSFGVRAYRSAAEFEMSPYLPMAPPRGRRRCRTGGCEPEGGVRVPLRSARGRRPGVLLAALLPLAWRRYRPGRSRRWNWRSLRRL